MGSLIKLQEEFLVFFFFCNLVDYTCDVLGLLCGVLTGGVCFPAGITDTLLSASMVMPPTSPLGVDGAAPVDGVVAVAPAAFAF